jgi:hypothetical protein
MRGIGISLGILLGSTYLSREFNVRRELFAAGEQGYWLDPSDFSTMFQDSAGTTPVTAVGQNVGRILDKSGRGNHFIQSSLASRPVLGRNPITGTRNLLTRTEDLSNVVWNKLNVTSTAQTITGNAGTSVKQIVQIASASATGRTVSFRAQQGSHRYIQVLFNGDAGPWANIDLQTGTVGSQGSNQTVSIASDPDGGYRVTLTTASTTAINFIVGLVDDGTAARGASSVSTDTLTLTRFQSELGSTATAYQRVGSAFDVTEAGVPDAYYLSYDGSDDFLVSAATINPGAVDKAQVFAGVRKLSDVALGLLVESSANAGSNNGAFWFFAPINTTNFSYGWRSRGTANADANGPVTGASAPITNVLTGLGDISGDSAILRVNGTQVASSTSDQGTGNFLTYLHYIGRRGGISLPFNGRIYQMITRFGPNLTADVLTQSEAFVAQKTGFYRPSITGVPTIS